MEDLKEQAVKFLRFHLREIAEEIRAAIAADPEKWWTAYHFNWGMAVRNDLREAGYGEMDLGVGNLDDIYVELVEKAVA